MRKTILKWSVLLLLLAYATVMAAICPHIEQSSPCQGFNVTVSCASGTEYITQEGVLLTLGDIVTSSQGKPIGSIDTNAIEALLDSQNSFESVQCFRGADNRIHILVEQMVPELRVFTDAESYYINKDGKKMQALPEFHANVPIATGKFSRNFTPRGLLPLTRIIERDSLLKNLVMMIKVDSPRDILLIPRTRGHVVNLGDTTRLSEKLVDLKLAYRKLLPLRGWEYYDTISVKFRGLLTATRRNKTTDNSYMTLAEEEDPEEAGLQDLLHYENTTTQTNTTNTTPTTP